MRVLNQTRSTPVATHVERASRLIDRMKGLLGRNELPEGNGLWIDHCNSIHTFFMRFPIDAVFVSKEGEVLRVYRNLKPFRLTRLVFKASSVLELPAGTLTGCPVEPGDRLEVLA
jgi:uncharacterized protein